MAGVGRDLALSRSLWARLKNSTRSNSMTIVAAGGLNCVEVRAIGPGRILVAKARKKDVGIEQHRGIY